MALYQDVLPIFLFKRPQRGDQLYCLVIWPSDEVLARTRKRARAYIDDRIQAAYAAISTSMCTKSSLSSLSSLEVGAILDQGWK